MKKILLVSFFITCYILIMYSQETITRNINVGFVVGPTTICKGDTVKMRVQTNCVCGIPYYNNTRAKNVGTCITKCIVESVNEIKIKGSNIISQTSKSIEPVGGCDDNFLLPECIAVPQQTSTYTVSWTKIHKVDKVPCPNSKEIIEVYNYTGSVTITVIDLPPPVIVPSKSKITLGESVQLKVTNCIAHYSLVIDDCSQYKFSGYCNNPIETYKPKSIGRLQVKGMFQQGSLPLCKSDWSSPITIEVTDCANKNFSTTGDTKAQMATSESAACNPTSRSDYHSYALDKTLCPTNKCTINDIWNLYKNKISNQAPIYEDFLSAFSLNSSPQDIVPFGAKALFPEPSWANDVISAGKIIILPSPEGFAFSAARACLYGECKTWYERQTKAGFPSSYGNPIAIEIDETNKCITNYTLKDHVLYPGKVTRCIVSECGVVKIKTLGHGLSSFDEEPLRKTIKSINEKVGKSLFESIDKRFGDIVKQKYPQIAGKQTEKQVFGSSVGIENKNWVIKEFRVKHPNYNEVTLFNRDNNDNFGGMKNIKFRFNTNGTTNFTNVQNQQIVGIWSTNGTTTITTDKITAELVSVSPNLFIISGKFKSFVDSNLVDAQYSYVFQLEPTLTGEYHQIKNTNINLFPNPTTGKIYIQNDEFQPYKVNVFNSLGQILLNTTVSNNELDISMLPSGLYQVELLVGNQKIQKRIVKN